MPLIALLDGRLLGAAVYDSLLYEVEGSIVTDAINELVSRDGSHRLD